MDRAIGPRLLDDARIIRLAPDKGGRGRYGLNTRPFDDATVLRDISSGIFPGYKLRRSLSRRLVHQPIQCTSGLRIMNRRFVEWDDALVWSREG